MDGHVIKTRINLRAFRLLARRKDLKKQVFFDIFSMKIYETKNKSFFHKIVKSMKKTFINFSRKRVEIKAFS